MSLVTPEVVTEEVVSTVEPIVETQTAVETKPAVETQTAVEAKPTVEPVSEVAVVAKQEVVSTPAARTLATQAEFAAEQEAVGLAGIEFDAYSFPRVKLHEGQFIKGDNEEMGKSFRFNVMSSRPLYVVSQSDDDDADMFYSYSSDGSTLLDGESSEEKLTEWREKGYATEQMPLVIKRYLEVIASVVSDDPDTLDIVSLSIPPASVKKFGGLAVISKMQYKRNLNDGVIVEANVGTAVRGGNGKEFRPWTFRLAGTM